LPRIPEQFRLTLVLNTAFAEGALQPRIKSAWMNTEHPAHCTDGKHRAMHFDERVSHFASLAKYAVAFFYMSRSSVTLTLSPILRH